MAYYNHRHHNRHHHYRSHRHRYKNLRYHYHSYINLFQRIAIYVSMVALVAKITRVCVPLDFQEKDVNGVSRQPQRTTCSLVFISKG